MSKSNEAPAPDKEALGFLASVKEAVQEMAPGLSLDKMIGDVGAELGRLGVQGSAEVASALFNGQAYVPYGRGQNAPGNDKEGVQQNDPEQDRGREM